MASVDQTEMRALLEELRGLTYDQATPEQVAQIRAYMRAQLAAADAVDPGGARTAAGRVRAPSRRHMTIRAVLDTSTIRAYSDTTRRDVIAGRG